MNIIPIKTNNLKGYDIAEDGDTIDISYLDSNTRRGRVAHQLSHTLTQNDNEQVVVLGNYHQSNHEASRIVSGDGLAPTVKENHGTVNAVVEPNVLVQKRTDCERRWNCQYDNNSPKDNYLYEPRCEQVMQIYPNSGNPQAGRIYNTDGISPAVDTCEGGNGMPKISEPRCIGGVGGAWGTQYHQQDRIYEGDIAMCHPANIPGGSYMYKIEEPFIAASRGRNPDNPSDGTTGIELEQRLEPNCNGITNTLTTVQKDNYVCEPCVDEGIKASARDNFLNEYENIKQSDKDIYQCKCDSGWQDNKIGLKTSPTIRSENNNTFAGYNSSAGFRIRKLTPKECWRLMGFDDADFEKASKVNSNSQLYKQAGNSIVVNVLEAIFRQMM